MNQFVDSWNRSQEREYKGPDSVTMDGEKFLLEESEMVDKPFEAFVALSMSDYNLSSLVRQIKNVGIGRVKVLKTITFSNLKRLGLKRDKSKAVAGIPKGSDQDNFQSFAVWCSKLTSEKFTKKDEKNREEDRKKALAQLVTIDATAAARVAG